MNTTAWLITYRRMRDGEIVKHAMLHNGVADYRMFDPSASAQEIDLDAVVELIKGCDLLLKQYMAVPEFTMGGALTNEPFTKIAAALARIGGEA